MAQKTTSQDQTEDNRTRGSGQNSADQGRDQDRRQDETEQMEHAASRVGGTARQEGQATAGAMREAGQKFRQEAERVGRSTERGVQSTGSQLRRNAEQMGERSQHLAETGADQFERMGEMMAQAARDASNSARMMMSFGNFTTGGFRDMQAATSGVVERLFQTNMDLMQRMINQANAAEIASAQQRIMRQYMETMAQNSADILRAVQRSADNALNTMGDGEEDQGRGRQSRRGGQGGQQFQQRGRQQGRQNGQEQEEQEEQQTIAEVMHRGLRTVGPDTSAREAAALMAEENVGVVPVVDKDKLVGMVTDRDIAIRLAGQGKDPEKTKVRDLMSADIVSCREDDPVDEVIERMAAQQLHRLPVLDDDEKPVGIVALADLVKWDPARGGEAMRGISRQSRQHAQTLKG